MPSKMVHDRLVFFPGDIVFAEGDAGSWAYLIQSGEVEILKQRSDGSEHRLAVLGPGRVFGEMALIDEKPRMATARALTQATLVLIDIYTFNKKMKHSDPFVRALLTNFSHNLRTMGERATGAEEPAGAAGPVVELPEVKAEEE